MRARSPLDEIASLEPKRAQPRAPPLPRFSRVCELSHIWWQQKVAYFFHTNNPRPRDGRKSKCPIKASSPLGVFGPALLKSELRLTVRTHLVADALFTFTLVILPMVAMVALLFLLGSAEPSGGVPDVINGTGMLILPP